MTELNIEYITLNRSIPSLSGGEFQRLRFARQISGSLVEILYVFDEPCRGLHRLDIKKIINATELLVKKGNTVLAIEHNQEYISHADNIIALGPGSGPEGGYVVSAELEKDVLDVSSTIKNSPDLVHNGWMEFDNINANNIHGLNCKIPMGVITCITGVSGSGKSTLAEDVVYECMHRNMAINCNNYSVSQRYSKIYCVDQKPVGKNARSSVISYLKIYDEIRKIFSEISVGKKKYKSSFFSTNIAGGRCEKCAGSGVITIENRYFPDSYIVCDECNGKKFKSFILDVRYKGKNISDVLDMDVKEALELFKDNTKIVSMLTCIKDIGLEYLKLGQLSKNLSGGEAQRLKLAKALGEEKKENNVYILDEPTSGLSLKDTLKIENVLHKLIELGNTIIIIEHNVNFITRNANYIIDFGFHGGDAGGKIIDAGSIKDVFDRKKASVWFNEA